MRRLLLDTHVALWALGDVDRLSAQSRSMIEDPANEVFVSAVSVWEVEIKRAIGKLEAPGDFAAECRRRCFDELAVSFEHAETAGRLPLHHSDPFDRMLIAQAIADDLELVSRDVAFGDYEVVVIEP